jgi:hypothetical protein
MGTVVIKPKNKEHGFFNLSPEEHKKAKEYLKSIGIDVDRLPKIVWSERATTEKERLQGLPEGWTLPEGVSLATQSRCRSLNGLEKK